MIPDSQTEQGASAPENGAAMPSTTCVLCGAPLTATSDSSEHILLRALGGRRQVSGFICIGCNSRSGQHWDAVLCKQLAHVSVMHGVDRQRSGTLPPVKVRKPDGGELLLYADGLMAPATPTFQEIETDRGKAISIVARSKDEARLLVEQYARKQPTVDVEAVLGSIHMTTTPNEDLLHFSLEVGGPHAGRSIVKSALAMAHAMGIGHEKCRTILPYLRGDDSEPPYGRFCERDLVQGRPGDHLIHCVAVKASPRTGQVLAYVEYFGIARYVVLLSNGYAGEPLQDAYAINPGSGEQIQVVVDLELSDEEIMRVVTGSGEDAEAHRQAIARIMPILLRRSEDRARRSAIDVAYQRALEALGIHGDEPLNEVQVGALSRIFAQEFVPYVLAMRRRVQAQWPQHKDLPAPDAKE